MLSWIRPFRKGKGWGPRPSSAFGWVPTDYRVLACLVSVHRGNEVLAGVRSAVYLVFSVLQHREQELLDRSRGDGASGVGSLGHGAGLPHPHVSALGCEFGVVLLLWRVRVGTGSGVRRGVARSSSRSRSQRGHNRREGPH